MIIAELRTKVSNTEATGLTPRPVMLTCAGQTCFLLHDPPPVQPGGEKCFLCKMWGESNHFVAVE